MTVSAAPAVAQHVPGPSSSSSRSSASSTAAEAARQEQAVVDAAELDKPLPTAANGKAKGISRLPLVRKLVNALVNSALVEIVDVDVKRPSADSGLTVAAKVKVTETGLGPLMIKAKIKFKGVTELCWPADPNDSAAQSSSNNTAKSKQKKGKSDAAAGRVIGQAQMADIKLAPSGPTAITGSTTVRLHQSSENDVEVGKFARAIIQTPVNQQMSFVLRAQGVSVKAYGITITGVTLQKELKVAGLGGLGGALRFDGQIPAGPASEHSPATVQEVKSKRSSLFSFGRKDGKRSPPQDSVASSTNGSVPSITMLMTQGLDITGGHKDEGISIATAVDLQLGRPSADMPSMAVQLGELRFTLNLPLGGGEDDAFVCVGQLRLQDALVKAGSNRVQAVGSIRIPPDLAPDSREAKACAGLFSSLLQNEAVELCAIGAEPERRRSGVSDAHWMAVALAGARIWATLPPLGDKARIIDGAQLCGEHELSLQDSSSSVGGVSRSDSNASRRLLDGEEGMLVRASLRNSFNVRCTIRRLKVVALESDPGDGPPLELGYIETYPDWEGIEIEPLQSMPATLPFQLNPDSVALIKILRTSAKREGVDLGRSFSKVLDMAQGIETSAAESSAANASSDPEDFADLLARAFANLSVKAAVRIEHMALGDYVIPGGISFTQASLGITISGRTSGLIVPRVGAPVVTKLVEAGRINIDRIDIKEIKETGLVANATLTLSHFGPLAAEILLENGSCLKWSGGERDGEIAALFFVNQPLRVDPTKPYTQTCEAEIVPSRGASPTSTFAQFLIALLQQDVTTWTFEAQNARVVAGKVEFFPDIAKQVTIKGFGGFSDLTTDSFDVVGEDTIPTTLAAQLGVRAGSMAISFRASVTLPNPSDISLSVTQLEADLLLKGSAIGHVSIRDLNLVRGRSTQFQATGLVYGGADAQALGDLASELLANQPVHVQVRGRTAYVGAVTAAVNTIAGQTRDRSHSIRSRRSSHSHDEGLAIEWLDAALRELTLNVAVRHFQHEVVQRIELERLEASFPRNGDPSIGIGALLVKYEVPLPIDVAIEEVAAEVEILLDDVVVGSGKTGSSQVVEAQEQAGSRRRKDSRSISEVEFAKGTLKIALDHFSLKTESNIFANLIHHVFDCEESNRISLRGVAHVSARTAIGTLPCHVNLGDAHKLRIKGMRSLSTSPTDYTGLQVVDASPERLKVTFDLFLNNPSKNVTFHLPDSGLSFAAFYRGAYVGRAYVGGDNGPFSLTSGPCAFKNVSFMYSPKESEGMSVRQLPANFLSGKVTSLEIRGDENSTELASLRPALSSLRLAFDLKPLADRMLIASISIALGAKVLTANAVECEFVISNPLLVPIDLTSLSFVANYKGKRFGSASMTWPEGQLLRVMPGEGPSKPGQSSGQCLVSLGQRLDQLVKAFLKERGQIYVQVDLSAGVEMGGYRIPV